MYPRYSPYCHTVTVSIHVTQYVGNLFKLVIKGDYTAL